MTTTQLIAKYRDPRPEFASADVFWQIASRKCNKRRLHYAPESAAVEWTDDSVIPKHGGNYDPVLGCLDGACRTNVICEQVNIKRERSTGE